MYQRRLFAGITAWSPLDIFDAGSSAVYFVGDPEEVADNVKAYCDAAGLSALILSGLAVDRGSADRFAALAAEACANRVSSEGITTTPLCCLAGF